MSWPRWLRRHRPPNGEAARAAAEKAETQLDEAMARRDRIDELQRNARAALRGQDEFTRAVGRALRRAP